MDFKDYYSILGVSPQADLKEIKKTYQKLAKKYHPDVNPGDKQAEDKFKEINEAYHAIADPVKRKKYDDLRADYEQWQNRGGRGSYDWSAWQEAPGSNSNSYTRTMSPEEFAEFFGGSGSSSEGGFGGFSDFFSTIFGMGSPFQSDTQTYYTDVRRQPRKGRDLQGEISITLEEAYHGAKKVISLDERRIEVTIPKGIEDNKKIRLSGQGEQGTKGGMSGDLLLTIKILPHQLYTRSGADLTANLEIDYVTAVLGGEARVKTPSGEMLLKIPPRTQAGKSFRLQGKGMPVLGEQGKAGDFYAKVSIVIPKEISDQEVSLLQEISKQR